MSTTRTILRDLPQARQDELVASAAAALRAGSLVVLPTETLYGVAANATSAKALDTLRGLARDRAHPSPSIPDGTWHAHDAAEVRLALDITHPLHGRMFDRLTPGPVRFVIEKDQGQAERLIRALGVVPGAFDRDGNIAVRIPDHSLTRRVLAAAGVPVIAERLSAFGWGNSRDIGDILDDEEARRVGIAAVLDDGPTGLGVASTTVRLTAAGGYAVLHEGALDAKTLERKIQRTVLFVCTGNTCRSPMAESIARALHERNMSPVPTVFRSAGIAAAEGSPASPEAREVLGEMGYPMGPVRSRELTKSLIAGAEVIFGMTRGHVRAVIDTDPMAKEKTFTLDQGGGDIPDPIGGPVRVYRETAEKLAAAIAQRLKEFDGSAAPAMPAP